MTAINHQHGVQQTLGFCYIHLYSLWRHAGKLMMAIYVHTFAVIVVFYVFLLCFVFAWFLLHSLKVYGCPSACGLCSMSCYNWITIPEWKLDQNLWCYFDISCRCRSDTWILIRPSSKRNPCIQGLLFMPIYQWENKQINKQKKCKSV